MSLIDQSAKPAPAPAPAADETTKTTPPTPEGDKKPEGETVSPAEGETKPDAALTDEQKASEAGKELAHRKQTANERIGDLTRQFRAADRRANEAERKLAELQGKLKAPNPADYDDMAKLNADQMDHTLDRRKADDLKSEAATASEEAEQAVKEAWSERAAAFAEDVPDFNEVAYKAPLNDSTSALVARMEEGPALAYYLGKHPAEARQINKLSERDKAIELGRLAGRLSQAPVRRTTQAPSPLEKVVTGKGGGGAAKVADLPFSDYQKLVLTETNGGKR